MPTIALICPPLPGHLNPALALGRALQQRGHFVVSFQIPALEPQVRASGLEFEPVGAAQAPALAASIEEMAAAHGLRSLRLAVNGARRMTELLCEELPSAFKRRNVDCVIVDQNEPAGAAVAEHLGIPFLNICPSLPLNREPDIPPPFVPWPYSPTPLGRLRNRIGYALSDLLISSINRALNRYRRRWNLPPVSQPDETFSPIAQLSQMVPEIDFPRRQLPAGFHYLGPFLDSAPSTVPFPFEKLNGKPLIYASLGTLQQRDSRYFHVIAEACANLDAQLVLPAGGQAGNLPQNLPGAPVVVPYAPQLEILSRASLAITHAGLNTVMQALRFGVPLVALPITHDQPAIAARVATFGAGETIPMAQVTAPALRSAVEKVLYGATYRARAQAICDSIARAGGVGRAASIVEDVLRAHAQCVIA